MAFNSPKYQERTIYDFKTRLSGGGARSNLFECDIKFPNKSIDNSNDVDFNLDLRFLIKAASLPSSTISSIPVPFRGRILKLAGDRTFEPWTITVLNDSNFRLRNGFEKWLNYMNRHDDNAGVVDPAKYQSEIIVHQLSRGTRGSDQLPATSDDIQILKSYKLWGAFPTSVSAIDLSYDQADTIEEFTVTFEYQWWDTFDGGNDTSILGTNETGGNTPPTVVGTNL